MSAWRGPLWLCTECIMQAHQAWKVFNMCSKAGACMPRLPAPLTKSAVRLAVTDWDVFPAAT